MSDMHALPSWVLDQTVPDADGEGFSELQAGISCRREYDHPTFALDSVSLDPRRFFRPHRHENLHILTIHRGNGFYYQDGQVAHLRRGATAIVNADAVHCLGAGPRGLVATVLSFPKSSLVGEQRGVDISPSEAAGLIPNIQCCGDTKCRYYLSTLSALEELQDS